MNATKKSWIKKIVLIISVFVMIFSLSMPIALAQDDAQQENNTENTNINTEIDDKSENNINQAVKACDEDTGGISIVVCPVVNLLMQGITRLTLGGGGQEEGQRKSPLISFLAVTPPRAVGDDGQPSRLAVVVNNVVTIANSIYILVFLILIFGSSLPFFTAQNYTIKKTLPKLIAAVILTQFTLVITGVIIDFFNLLGYAIPNVILALGQVPPDIVGSGGVTEKVGAGLGATITGAFAVGAGVSIVTAGFGWIFIIGFLIAAIISVIIGFVYMVLRYFLIYVMILIAPLAFVAWVIPGTEKFFKQWWTDFIRLNAMFVTIMALLSASIVIASALTGQEDTGLGFLPALMPIIALFLIPKTLKATTKGLSALSGAVLGAAGAATGKATSKAKDVGKARIQEQRAESAAKAFGKNTRFGRAKAALFQGKLPTQKGQFEAGQKVASYNAEQRKIKTEGIEFQGSKLAFPEYQKQLRLAASGQGSSRLGIAAGDKNAQIAAGNLLAQQGDVEHIRAMVNGTSVVDRSTGEVTDYSNHKITTQELSEIVQPSFGDIKAAAPDLTSGGSTSALEGLSAEKIAALDHTSITLAASTPGGLNNLKTHAQQIYNDNNLRNKLNKDQIKALNAAGLGVTF